jgi:hypothetical protein
VYIFLTLCTMPWARRTAAYVVLATGVLVAVVR